MNTIPTFDEMIDAVCVATGIERCDLMSKARKEHLAYARFILYSYAYESGINMPMIAEQMGRDHTCVLHGIQRIEEMKGALFPAACERRALAVLASLQPALKAKAVGA